MKLMQKSLVRSMAMLGIVGFGLAVLVPSAHAAVTDKVCDQAVQSIKNEWKTVDFDTPLKATQMRVEGKMGHENTAGQVAFMQWQIKLAEQDCQSGNQQSALQRVSSVHDLIGSHDVSEKMETAAITTDNSIQQ